MSVTLVSALLCLPMMVLSRPSTRSLDQSAATCLDGFQWMDNKQGFSPCLVAAYVDGACTTNVWNTPSLIPGYSYNVPNSSYANACTCSWASYNLLNACTACQDSSDFLAWADYLVSPCQPLLSDTYFPPDVILPDNTTIPYWASMNPQNWTNAEFDVTTAQTIAAKDYPDLSPGTSPASVPSMSPTPSASPNKSIVGPVVGGVVGGVAGLIAIASGIAFYVIRRKRLAQKKVPMSIVESTGDRPGMHGRSQSDLSWRPLNRSPGVLGDLGGGAAVISRGPSQMTQTQPAMVMSPTSGSIGHTRTLTSSTSVNSLSLSYAPQQQSLASQSPPTMTSPLSSPPWTERHLEDVIVPFTVGQPTPDVVPTKTLQPRMAHDVLPRPRLNPPAYTLHADNSGMPPQARPPIHARQDSISNLSTESSALSGLDGLVGQLRFGPETVGTFEAGDTYASSPIGAAGNSTTVGRKN